MALLQLPSGFKYKFFFSTNFLIVIEVGSSGEGGGGVVVCSAPRCPTLEVDVGAKNVVAKCGDVLYTNPMEKKKKQMKVWKFNYVI
jgi:hypothetical protein